MPDLRPFLGHLFKNKIIFIFKNKINFIFKINIPPPNLSIQLIEFTNWEEVDEVCQFRGG